MSIMCKLKTIFNFLRGINTNSPLLNRESACHCWTYWMTAGKGLGESQFRRLEKKLSTLPTLLCLR
jgi:hypothetical protein